MNESYGGLVDLWKWSRSMNVYPTHTLYTANNSAEREETVKVGIDPLAVVLVLRLVVESTI
jgi:hypothetical protein